MRKSGLASIAAASVLVLSSLAMSSGAFAADSSSETESSTKDGLTLGGGWYVSGSAGLAYLENSTSKSGASHFDASGDNPGFDVTGAVGKQLSNGFRLEEELGYHQINLDHVTTYGGGQGSGTAGGDMSALSLMTNGYYDFDTGGPIKPFVGAGIGFARVGMNDVTVRGQPLVDDSDVDFAYQGMAGVGYQLTPHGTLYTQYRYFAVNDPTFNAAGGGQVRSEMATHNIEIGYRLTF